MEIFFVAKFTCTYEGWKSVYDGDLELRKQFMKNDIVGKVDENTAMIKATITNPKKNGKDNVRKNTRNSAWTWTRTWDVYFD